MIYAYDTEFLEHEVRTWPTRRSVRTIELISIGIVAEDRREYYAVAADAPWRDIRKHDWLMANVIPSLPQIRGDRRHHLPSLDLGIEFDHPRVKPRAQIASEVHDFLLAGDSPPELWASYGAYDHVVQCWLYGAMTDLPEGLPMWTHDLQQEASRRGTVLPEQETGHHDALADARHVMTCLRHLGVTTAEP